MYCDKQFKCCWKIKPRNTIPTSIEINERRITFSLNQSSKGFYVSVANNISWYLHSLITNVCRTSEASVTHNAQKATIRSAIIHALSYVRSENFDNSFLSTWRKSRLNIQASLTLCGDSTTQDDHFSGRKWRRKQPKTAKKRRFTAVILTLYHRNPSFQIKATVSNRFLLPSGHLFTPYFYTFLEWRITATYYHGFFPFKVVSGRFKRRFIWSKNLMISIKGMNFILFNVIDKENSLDRSFIPFSLFYCNYLKLLTETNRLFKKIMFVLLVFDV